AATRDRRGRERGAMAAEPIAAAATHPRRRRPACAGGRRRRRRGPVRSRPMLSLFPLLDPDRHDEVALDDLTRTRTWAELDERATRLGRHLRHDLGLAAGEHAAVVMGNRVEHLEVLLGALASGV